MRCATFEVAIMMGSNHPDGVKARTLYLSFENGPISHQTTESQASDQYPMRFISEPVPRSPSHMTTVRDFEDESRNTPEYKGSNPLWSPTTRRSGDCARQASGQRADASEP